jgi:hypothetical protein
VLSVKSALIGWRLFRLRPSVLSPHFLIVSPSPRPNVSHFRTTCFCSPPSAHNSQRHVVTKRPLLWLGAWRGTPQSAPSSCTKPPQCPLVHVLFVSAGVRHDISMFLVFHKPILPRPIVPHVNTHVPTRIMKYGASLRTRGQLQVFSSILFLGDIALARIIPPFRPIRSRYSHYVRTAHGVLCISLRPRYRDFRM